MNITPKLGTKAADELRRALDVPELRHGSADRPPLHLALYRWLKNLQSASDVYEKIIKRAEVERVDRVFIDPGLLSDAMRDVSIDLKGDPSEIDTPPWALAHFVLAFALLQPGDADALIAALSQIDDAYTRFFSSDLAAPAESSEREAGNTKQEPVHEGSLMKELGDLRQELEQIGLSVATASDDYLQRGQHPSRELGTAIISFSDRFNEICKEIAADGELQQVISGAITTLKDVETVLEASKTKQDAQDILADVVARLRRVDGRSEPAINLLASRSQATGRSLAEIQAAVRDLQKLVVGIEQLEDTELQELRDSVAQVLGTEIARLASRGLLTLATDGVPQAAEVAVEPSVLGASEPEPTPELVTDFPVTHLDDQPLPEMPTGRSAPSPAINAGDAEKVVARPESTENLIAASNPSWASAFTALREGRVGLAYQIALSEQAAEVSALAELPPSVAGAAVLAPYIRFSSGELSLKFAEFVQSMFEFISDDVAMTTLARHGVVSLMACTLLRPALLAPRTNATDLLAQLEPRLNRFPKVKQLVASVHRFSQLGLELTPALLKGVREHAAWADRVAESRQQCAAWLEHERVARIIYAPATDVWRHWLRDDGFIGKHLLSVHTAAGTRQSTLASACEELRDQNSVEAQITRVDKLMRGRSAVLRPIEARSKGALVKRAAEAADLIDRYSALVRTEPKAEATFRNREAEQCRESMQGQIPTAIWELQEISGRTADLSIAAALKAAAVLLENLRSLFDEGVEIVDEEPPPRELLASDLLAIPSIKLDENWEPDRRTPALLEALVDLANRNPIDWLEAFDRHREHGDHVSTARLLEYLETQSTNVDLEKLRKQRAHDLHERRSQLLISVSQVRSRLNQAVMLDLLSESELLALSASLDAIDPKTSEDFEGPTTLLAEAVQQIDRAEKLRAAQVRERFKAAEQLLKPAMIARIDRALESREFFVANDLIDAAVEGRSLDDDLVEDHFRLFFPKFTRELTEFLAGGKRSGRELINDIRAQRSVGPLDMTHVPGAQAADAARTLEAWFHLKNPSAGGNLAANMKDLFEGLGFSSVSVDGRRPATDVRRWSCQVRTMPLADREACVIPAFGSGARGTYRVLSLWERPSEDEILTAVSPTASQAPWIVLYLGQMTDQRRRDLAVMSRQRRRTFILLDECLIFFLCCVRGSRLPVLFNCSLPFTVSDPYVTTASLVPPEMFFGRVVEREAIVDQFGTNLVYGGRQLGKTALLRDIERRYQGSEDGLIVKWIDLQTERIGITRPLDDVWEVIGSVLRACNVLPQQPLSADRIVKRVTAWLEENRSRRILLLLDEADVFLESDSRNGYTQLTALKGLMDASERRFKVVFAGLHNVQRASRDPNTPLAHLGQPVCIGPLLHEREAREALGLVTRPLEALGFRFETPDLPLRILSYANYYPSLIQIYCKHLLEDLADPGRSHFDPRQSPPFTVSGSHLDAVQNNELREKILDKFRLTLNLDPRYKVIALCMAHAGAGQAAAEVLVGGVSPEWVRNEAVYWWPAGFEQDSSIEGFRTILDEMIGLGILRRSVDRRYALRSPNIINLLGTRAEIDAALVDAARQEPTPAYQAATFRRADRADAWQRSPLTAQQEAEILQPQNGIVVVCGSQLSGMDGLTGFLRLACEAVGYEDGTDLTDAAQLMRRIDAIFDREREGVTVLHVPALCPWSENWIQSARAIIGRKTSRRREMRVVLEADPRQTWAWRSDPEPEVLELGLKPWSEEALKRWLHDTGIAAGDAAAWQKISDVTGRWSDLLADFARRVAAGGKWQGCLEEINEQMTTDEVAKRAGLFGQARAVLQTMADYGDPASIEDLAQLCSQARQLIRQTMRWAERLSYVRVEAQDCWQLNSFLALRLRGERLAPNA